VLSRRKFHFLLWILNSCSFTCKVVSFKAWHWRIELLNVDCEVLRETKWYGLGSSYRNVTLTLYSWWIIIDPVVSWNRISLRTFIHSLIDFHSWVLSLAYARLEIPSPHTDHPTLLGQKRQTTYQSCHVLRSCKMDVEGYSATLHILA